MYPYVEKPGEQKGGSNPKFRWRVPLAGWEGIITRRAAGGAGAPTMLETTFLSDAHLKPGTYVVLHETCVFDVSCNINTLKTEVDLLWTLFSSDFIFNAGELFI